MAITSENGARFKFNLREKSKVKLYPYIVRKNSQVAHDIWELELHVSELASSIQPGQFMNLEAPGAPEHITRIPLSFYEANPVTGCVKLIYAVVGQGTKVLSQLAEGAESSLVGPCGHGWELPASSQVKAAFQQRACLLIAGGVGAPPIIAATKMLCDAGYSCDVVLGARSKDMLWGEDAARTADARQVFPATDDGSYGYAGFTTELAAELLANTHYHAIYTCGPAPMMRETARLAAEHGISCQVSLERMMGCGFGACSTCNVALVGGGYANCCSDGPVFCAEEVLL